MRRKFIPELIFAVFLALAGENCLGVDKLVDFPIRTDYGITDSAFTNSISGLLRSRVVGGNKIQDLNNGVEYFPAMLSAIANAQKTITFENFIWRSGEVSDRFIEALSERARAGVKVHCIIDGFGALKLKSKDKDRIRAAGVQLQIFNRIRPWTFFRWNHRTHRKTLVIDGKIGFIGGICIADEWDGNAQSHAVWRDTEFRVEGPAWRKSKAFSWITGFAPARRCCMGRITFPVLTNVGGTLWRKRSRADPKMALKTRA
jgi:cardiolipin synthase